ncbi:MAG: SCO family protein [Bacteroidetes bacterium]|nr:SCO family protein [Bacteroidota bacterium]
MFKKIFEPRNLIVIFLLAVLPLIIFYVFNIVPLPNLDLPRLGPKHLEERIVNGDTIMDTVFHVIPPFELTNQLNNRITNEDLKGNVYVADFFFTKCGSICPTMTRQLARVQEEFVDQEDFLIVSHSIDPRRDSVEALAAYAEKYGADNSMWYFLTGEKQEIYDLANKGYLVTAMDADVPDDYIHSPRFLLIDKEGVIRGQYTGTDPEEVDKLIKDINVLFITYDMKKKK